MTSFTVGKLFTGTDWLDNQCISVEAGIIKNIVPSESHPTIDLLIPPFVDLQLYGAGGFLFSEFPTVETLDKIYVHCLHGGTTYFMPTLATNSKEVFREGIEAVKAYWAKGGKGCIGLHLEGPWINPTKKGAHVAAFIHSPTISEVEELLKVAKGVVKLVTLAPEMCSRSIVNLLLEYGIKLSAGHSDASFSEAMDGFSNGICCVTHLFNAMSSLQHRAPGLVGATLYHPSAMASIIPDGYHVDWPVISIAHQVMGNRLFVITDAVTNCATGPYQHELKVDHFIANGVLSGSALTMLQAFNNLIQHASLSVEDATMLCAINPVRAIGINNLQMPIQIGKQFKGISLKKSKQHFELIQVYD